MNNYMEEVKDQKEQNKERKICSFFKKVTPDAWVIAGAILLASIFLIAALLPGGLFMRKGGENKQNIAAEQVKPTAPQY